MNPKHRRPKSPGEILREEFRIPYEGDDITPESALMLAEKLGTTPEFWINLQVAYDMSGLHPCLCSAPTEIKTIQTTGQFLGLPFIDRVDVPGCVCTKCFAWLMSGLAMNFIYLVEKRKAGAEKEDDFAFYKRLKADYAALTPEERAEEKVERRAWDATLSDGLKDDE